MQSLIKYAEQLEKAGNSESAAAVYELIAQGGGSKLTITDDELQFIFFMFCDL